MEYARKQTELVVFDVDGTLLPDTPDDNSGRAFWRLNEEGIFHSSDETLERLSAMREKVIHDPSVDKHDYCNQLITEYDSQIRGASIAGVKRIYSEIVDQAVSEHIYPELSEEITFWKDYGAKLAIVSGSPDNLVQTLKRRLNFDIATGTRHFRQGNVYHSARQTENKAAEKHLIVEKMRLRLGDQAIFAAAYGDTMNDLSMLAVAKKPVTVNPKPDLHQFATQNNWEILTTAEVA
jgi:HAD superfamily phosphoserine phosphatase-like hydrolase